MTVIKAHVAQDLRPLPPAVAAKSRSDLAPSQEDPRIAALTTEVEETRAALANLRDQAKVDAATAREDGARDARRTEEERLAALEAGIGDALTVWHTRLETLERLAAQLAVTALATMFDDHADLSDLVGRTIGKRVRAMGAAAVVRARVSDQDFADTDAIGMLAERCGLSSATVVADPDLPAGGCTFDLSMGHMDLSIASQWRNIEQQLVAIAAGDAA